MSYRLTDLTPDTVFCCRSVFRGITMIEALRGCGCRAYLSVSMLGSQSGGRVPVTAKLSRKFYERFGDDVTTELVDWFNAVDDTYRNQLKEINELNWERFKAHLDARIAELRTEMATLASGLREELRKGLTASDEKFAGIDKKFAAIDVKFARVDEKFAVTDGKIAAMGASLQNEFHREMRELFRWTAVFWITTIISIIGVIVAILKYGGR